MKTIPQVREELLKLANTLDDRGTVRKLKNLVKHMYRRAPVRRAGREHIALTPMLVARIKKVASMNSDISYATLGRMFNVSIGRVSEALAGKRAA